MNGIKAVKKIENDVKNTNNFSEYLITNPLQIAAVTPENINPIISRYFLLIL